MLFNSYVFWVFFLAVIVLYWRLPQKQQNRLLLVASYVFYGAWDLRFLLLLLGSTIVDFFVGQALQATDEKNARRRRSLLGLSLFVNLGALGFFKYWGFFAEECAALLEGIGIHANLPLIHVILPVGISFYTFQTLSYSIDVFRRETQPVKNFFDFALYVSFFPQLVAGPIERSSRLLPQITQTRRLAPGAFKEGLYLVLLGMFKKVVVADNVAGIVNTVFAGTSSDSSGIDGLLGLYAFALQIYCDFSGYSSIARGISKWMGFELMVNFRTPYFSTNPSEFWRRWHISLSTWLRDYLYIPLGGNRGGRLGALRNLMLTMLLGGLWHGAGWTFLAWGAFHGSILCLYRLLPARGKERAQAPFVARVLQGLFFFHLVCLGWLFFRAESLAQCRILLESLALRFTPSEFSLYFANTLLFYAGPLILFEAWTNWRRDALALLRSNFIVRGLVYAYMAVMLWVFSPDGVHQFIYFQF